MDGKSLTPQELKLKQLRDIMPEVFSEGKVDLERLKATLGEDINFSNERYVLNWAGKSDAFKALQMPSTKTLVPSKDESVDFDTTENIFIEGENLEVLKILQKSYFGKIKMIYIDPPYNTGNDSFIYPDKFSETKDEYQRRVGDKDEEGYMTREGMFKKNSKENGQYHSNWLNMMYPRLFLAKNLLRQDGVIFVSIDDNEVHNLRLAMNEIFGEENFLAQIVWQKIHSIKNDAKYFSDSHEYLICYSKSIENVSIFLLPRTEKMDNRFKNPDNDSRGPWSSGDLVANGVRTGGHFKITGPTGNNFNVPPDKHWVYSYDNMSKLIQEGRIWFGKNGEAFPRLKRYLSEVQKGRKADTLWLSAEVGHNQESKREVKALFNDKIFFDTPKPLRLLKRAIQITLNQGDIILDFFTGSGTTAHAVMEINKEDGGNRKYICVQLPELCDEKSEAFKAGYKTIADIAKERIRRAAKKIATEIQAENEKKKGELNFDGDHEEKLIDLGFKVLKLSGSNFKQWQQIEGKDAKALEEQMKMFVDPVSESATTENLVYELLLKSGKDLNTTIEHKDGYFRINTNEMVLMLEKATQEIVTAVLNEKPQKVIALDRLFKGNDQLKTNTVLQMKDAGIEFKTI